MGQKRKESKYGTPAPLCPLLLNAHFSPISATLHRASLSSPAEPFLYVLWRSAAAGGGGGVQGDNETAL